MPRSSHSRWSVPAAPSSSSSTAKRCRSPTVTTSGMPRRGRSGPVGRQADLVRERAVRPHGPGDPAGRLRSGRLPCQYCPAEAESIDHVVPRSRGGQHVWENVVASCRRCNVRKGNRTPAEAGMPSSRPPRPQALRLDLRLRRLRRRPQLAPLPPDCLIVRGATQRLPLGGLRGPLTRPRLAARLSPPCGGTPRHPPC
jgi:5-methylcytosine-specific restriction endonuclease McrA